MTPVRPVWRGEVWLGEDAPSLGEVTVRTCGRVTLGLYGGHPGAGAHKNEDAAVVWDCGASTARADAVRPGDPGTAEAEGWTFGAVLDAHGSSQSARAVTELLLAEGAALRRALRQPPAQAFGRLERRLRRALGSAAFRATCRDVRGETALLCCATRGRFLWWFSVGDAVAYLLHPDLTALGQDAVNTRHFYTWVGQVNTFEGEVPACASGVLTLRPGHNDVVLLTDGVLEFGARPLEAPGALAALVMNAPSGPDAARAVLAQVHTGRGRDSATFLHWRVRNPHPAPLPSA